MSEPDEAARLERAIAAIDAANALDPNRIEITGELRPKELAHAELVTRRIEQLVEEPDAALRLAARAHHLKRWQRPRSEQDAGRAGYHRWRRELQRFHADEAAKILVAEGYEAALIARVGSLICKRDLATDRDAQALEDALCLVFVETQLAGFARQHSEPKVLEILVKSLRKMSPAGRAAAAGIGLPASEAHLLARAVSELDSAS